MGRHYAPANVLGLRIIKPKLILTLQERLVLKGLDDRKCTNHRQGPVSETLAVIECAHRKTRMVSQGQSP
jgi:hypothetical protein